MAVLHHPFDTDTLSVEAQVLQLVRLGRMAIVLAESARINLGEGLAVVPLSDAEKVTTVIARPPHSTSPGVAGLVRTAARL